MSARRARGGVEESRVQEFYTIFIEWCDEREPEDRDLSKMEVNLRRLEDFVNEHLAEGWEALGPPRFSESWMRGERTGKAIQSLVRRKNVEQAVVVEIPAVITAECVKPVRSSLRLIPETRN